jgi:hypothetical protein
VVYPNREGEVKVMPRINIVNKARKAQGTCGRCGAKIKKGDPYKWWKFRFGGKRIRCANCVVRGSELTQSKRGEILAQEEALEDAVSDFRSNEDFDAFESAIEDIINELDNLADDARSSFENMPEGLQQGDTGQMLEQRADSIDEFKDELESAKDNARSTWDSFESDDDEEEDKTSKDDAEAKSKTDVVDEIASEFDGLSYSGE